MKVPEYTEYNSDTKKRIERQSRYYEEIAGDRVLLYLRCLNFPAPQALDLALRAVREAERKMIQGGGNNPVVEAMQALRNLLVEQGPGVAGNGHSLNNRCESPMPSTSPIHRLHMIPEEISPVQLRSLFANLLKEQRNDAGASP